MSIFISEFLLGGSGKRVAIKDSIDIAGHATQSGSRAFAHALPALRNAGLSLTNALPTLKNRLARYAMGLV